MPKAVFPIEGATGSTVLLLGPCKRGGEKRAESEAVEKTCNLQFVALDFEIRKLLKSALQVEVSRLPAFFPKSIQPGHDFAAHVFESPSILWIWYLMTAALF